MRSTHIRSSTDYKCYLCLKKIRRQADAVPFGRPRRPKSGHIWCKEQYLQTAASEEEAASTFSNQIESRGVDGWILVRFQPSRLVIPQPFEVFDLCAREFHFRLRDGGRMHQNLREPLDNPEQGVGSRIAF